MMKARFWAAGLLAVVSVGVCCRAETPGRKASLYDLTLRWEDSRGAPVEWQNLRGRVAVVAMFFSSCTYACPRITADLKSVAEQLPASVRDRVVFVMVSFDVENDQPPVLRAFAESQGLSEPLWLLLHGEDDEVRTLAAALDIRFRPDPAGGFAHSNSIIVLDPKGVVAYRKDGLGGDVTPVAQRAVALAGE